MLTYPNLAWSKQPPKEVSPFLTLRVMFHLICPNQPPPLFTKRAFIANLSILT